MLSSPHMLVSYRHLLSFLCCCLWLQSFGQAQDLRIPDDPQGRIRHELEMLADPNTGKIPENIRLQELNYVYSSRANLQPSIQRANGYEVRNNATWTSRGPYNVGGRTRAVGIDSRNSNILLAGGASGGMYRSTDQGQNWTLVSNIGDHPSVTGIAQDPTSRDTWYYITGETAGNSASGGSAFFLGQGVFKSTDNGRTWQQLSSTIPVNRTQFGSGTRNEWQQCYDIAIDPVSGAVLVSNLRGIYRSTNGGTSWTQVVDASISQSGQWSHLDVVSTGTNSRLFYASTHSFGTQKGIFRSTDGINWTPITLPSSFPNVYRRIEIAIAPSNPDIVWFLVYESNTSNKLYRYQHSAGDWSDRSEQLPDIGGSVGNFNPQGGYNYVIKVKPDNPEYVFIGATNLHRSSDGFQSKQVSANTGPTQWIGGYSPANNVSSYPDHHPDIHTLVFLPGSNISAICGHDGGLSLTTDITTGTTGNTPVQWRSLNNGYLTTQIYAIAIDPYKGFDDKLMAGFQDNGNWITTSPKPDNLWGEERGGGDGAWNSIVTGTDIRYFSQQNGSILRNRSASPSSFNQIDGIQPSQASGQRFINPFILDKNVSNRMYYPAGLEMWRNNDLAAIESGFTFQGTTTGWVRLSTASLSSGSISALDVSKTPANVLYYGTNNGQIYRIDNAHLSSTPTRTNIYSDRGLPSDGFVSCITVDETDANRVFVAFSNYGIRSVFYTTNGGQTWTDISGNLEENPDGTGNGPSVRWVAIHRPEESGDVIYYAGTSTGLYSTTQLNGLNTVWTQEGANSIGNVPVVMIRTRAEDGLVAIGTHGRGAFNAKVGGKILVTSIEESLNAPTEKLVLFPNPTTDELIIALQQTQRELAKAEIYDLQGRLVQETLLRTFSGQDLSTTVSLSQLPAGTYLVRVITAEQVFNERLMKQ
ncbi:T9SS type A sorting domain-containing protein [Eisenibacter elegans]|uniref:T9SS type A sorting domain-containing protein n=1 Tax=Eisenibacter elegans TaxID=997 RepID=UPI0009D70667|nr:T9SS type A sorting domain-containing protein [Eisenibacter elegans]